MPDTYTHLLYHVVFSTKGRAPLLTSAIRERMDPYLAGVVRNLGGTLVEVGGVEDHLHLLLHLKPTDALSNVMRAIKANTSKMVNEESLVNGAFRWQVGYGAFTVASSGAEQVRRYIRRQAQHHRERTFPSEMAALLQAHRVPFDEQDLLDRPTGEGRDRP